MDLSLSVRQTGRGTTVEVDGEVDHGSGRQLLACALDVMHEHGPWMSVDLAKVTFMDSGGVGVLMTLRSRARMRGGRLRLVAASAPVLRVLDIVGMDTTLTLRAR